MDVEENNKLKTLREILEGKEDITYNPFKSLPEKNKIEALKFLYEQSGELRP